MLLINAVAVIGQDATSVAVAVMNVQLKRKMAKMETIKVTANAMEANQEVKTSLAKDASDVDLVADMAIVEDSEEETIAVVNRSAMEQHQKMTEQLASQRENALAMETENHHVHHAEEASEEEAVAEASVVAPDVHVQMGQEVTDREMDPEVLHVVVMFRMVSHMKEAAMAHQEAVEVVDSPDLSVHATLKAIRPAERRMMVNQSKIQQPKARHKLLSYIATKNL